jgi:hypothetical protein
MTDEAKDVVNIRSILHLPLNMFEHHVIVNHSINCCLGLKAVMYIFIILNNKK